MDEEFDPDNENVNDVLAQETSELLTILSFQSPTVIMQLCQMIPGDAGLDIKHPASSAEAPRHRIKAMLEYFRKATAADCCNFLQNMCILCENIPMHLEARLMSVAGYANTMQIPAPEPQSLKNTDDCENSSSNKTSSPPSECRLVKRLRIDHWEHYIVAVMSLVLNKWEQLNERLVREVSLENVRVSPRTVNRSRDRPDQAPGPADREPDVDYGSVDSRLTLQAFLQGCAGKVTVLVGQSGSGKTLLMSGLGQQWAKRQGPVPSSFLFVLLELRQLKLVSCPLSLSELLFRHYLPPRGSNNEKRAIMDHLLSNPEQSFWVLDGYDEVHSKVTRQDSRKELLDPGNPLPVADLISGLLNRQLLPGCTVMVTCRSLSRDLEGMSDKVGQLLGWDCQDIKEYVHNFFDVKANRALGVQAADLLLSSQHLLSMSSIPALCNICCICLGHLLLEGRDAKKLQIREDSDNTMMDATNSRAQLLPTQAQIPSTLTQVYLMVLAAFLSCDPEKKGRKDKPRSMTPQQSTVHTLSQYRSELCELSQLAWKAIECNKIIFMEEDISPEVLKFSIRTGLFSQVELRHEDGTLINAYCFIHLTVQEFLAALRIMTSQDVSDMQLKKRFSLKTRWTTRSDQRTIFEVLHLYVCGLASPYCTPSLLQLARISGGTGGQSWVQKRQAFVLTLLKNLCKNSTLTGPKVLELCRCVQESQGHQLAQLVVDTRPILELRNIRLLPNDIDALAFVANSVGENGIGLDFGACSMELECLDVLPRCQYIHHLCFRGRKYGDKFAEKLSCILPKFQTLRKLEFCGASLTEASAVSLASALQNCPDVTAINLSDNNLKDTGIKHIADVFTKLPKLESVMLGQNNTSLKAVDYLIRKLSSCLNIELLHANGMKEVTVTFSQNLDLTSHKPSISLLNQNWSKPEMEKLAESLACCPAFAVLDVSGGQWDVETLRTLAQFLPKFTVTKNIILNDSCSSLEGLVVLTALLSDCAAVMELHIKLCSPAEVSVVFSGGREKPAGETAKILCLSCCDLRPAHLEGVWRSLGTSSDLTLLDLSGNCLGNRGLRKVLGFLPQLKRIQEINVSNNNISMDGVLMLAGVLCDHDNLAQIHISHDGSKQVILKFCPNQSHGKQHLKTFRINNSTLLQTNMNTLCRRLVQCHSHLELDSLKGKAITGLLNVLPKMMSLRRLNVSHSPMSPAEALMLVSCLTVSQQVTSVELRCETESFIHFDSVKAKHASCSITHFCLNGDNLETLLKILQRGPHLSDLDLSSNQLEDGEVKHFLDSLPDLKITRFINLSNNSLTQQGLLDVASTLCTCANISGVEVSLGAERKCLIWFTEYEGGEKTLSINDSNLGCDHLVRLAELISACSRLTKLELKNNLLQPNWINNFVKRLNSSKRGFSISIEESWIRSEGAVNLVCHSLDHNSNIHTIKVHGTTLHLSMVKSTDETKVSDDSADMHSSLAIEKISLVDCAVEGHQLASMTGIIKKCPSLTELDFSHNKLGSEGAEFLCSILPLLPNLTSLSIASKETCVAAKLPEALLKAATIQCLNLSGHVISDTVVQVLARLLPRLQSLNLSYCVWSVPEGLQLIEALGQCVSLESLWLNNTAAGTEQSGAYSVLDLLAAMQGLTRMEEIGLEGWKMADRGIEQLTRLLPVWKKLRKISLSKNFISDQSGDRLLEALNSCSHLEELHLSSNSLGDISAARMALVLPSLSYITVLDISDNRLGHEGSMSLSKAIMYMKNLTRLHLTSVGTSELCAVATSLAHCPLIHDVGLGWNNCGDEVAVELARVMPHCQKLTKIDLESNSVSVIGAEALVRALHLCPALQLIRLWRNQVSSSEARRLSLKDRRLNFSST